jgi:anti-sigma regulatory factor (Ser/Thr protein kinase)
MTLTKDRVLRLWPVPTVCGEARHAVRQFCAERGLEHLSDDAELMTSELVTNAVRHATTLFTVVFVERNAAIVVGVVGDAGDDEPASLHPAVPPDALAESGRGLFVVDQLADEWGTSMQGAGTAVWFRLS